MFQKHHPKIFEDIVFFFLQSKTSDSYKIFKDSFLFVLNFKLMVTLWSIGWYTPVQFSGKKMKWILVKILILGYATQLPTSRAILLFFIINSSLEILIFLQEALILSRTSSLVFYWQILTCCEASLLWVIQFTDY